MHEEGSSSGQVFVGSAKDAGVTNAFVNLLPAAAEQVPFLALGLATHYLHVVVKRGHEHVST